MDLELTEEQEALRDTARQLLGAHSTPDDVRALEDDATGFRAELWQAMGELDLIGLALPEQHGGSGMSALETAVLYAELGRALASTPHLVSAVAGAGVLLSADHDSEWLPRIASGEAIVSLAWHELSRGDGPEGVQLSLKGREVAGTKIRVPYASAADALVVLARSDAGVDAVLVDPRADGVTLTQTVTMSGEADYEVTFEGAEVSSRVGAPGSGWGHFEAALSDVLVAVAAYAAGAAERALELAVRYAKEREQFGKPIGSFQGLAHPLADMATEVNGARTLAYRAAWMRATGRDLGPLAHMAKYYACDVFKRTTKVAQQVFGGMGFTREVDIQLYFRRAKQLELSWLGPAGLSEVVAAAELDGPAGFVSVDGGD